MPKLLTIALLLVALPALSQQIPYPPIVDIEPRPGFVIEKQVITEREIPVLLFSKDSQHDEKKPVVFLIHGGGMPDIISTSQTWAKEGWFDAKYHDVPYTLAEGGLLVVLFDLWWASEREKPEYEAIVRKNYLHSVILGFVETTRDIPLLIDALAENPAADVSRIGVTGRSGGGIISLMAAATEPRVTAVTSWVGGPDMVAWAHDKMPARMVEHYMTREPDIAELLAEYDPVHQFANMPPTAVLMINNENDPAVPVATARALHQTLLPLYSETPERLSYVERLPNEPTHAMSEQDYDEGCAWLIRHLNAPTN